MTPGRSVAALLILLFPSQVAVCQAQGREFTYVSPVPGSRYVPAGTSIAFRTVRPNGFRRGETLSVEAEGSASGPHAGALVASDDPGTWIFTPSRQFLANETVSVRICVPADPRRGRSTDTLRFSFVTGRYADIAERARVPEGPIPLHSRGAGIPSAQRTGATDSIPPGFPAVTVKVSNNPPPMTIYLSDFPFDPLVPYTPFLMTISADGTPTSARRLQYDAFDFKKQPGGLLTYHDGGDNCFLAMDSTFAVVDSFRCGNGYPTDVHDLRLMPDGHALLLGYDAEHVRMDSVVPGGDSSAIVYGLILQELDRSKNVVFQWRSWDHFRITDAIGIDLTAHVIDYVHGNAIELDSDGNFVLSSRHLSEITKIDRMTGAILWRWGGKNNQFTFLNDTAGFSYQHMIRRLPGGHWTLFDNGNDHTPPYSRAAEYALDEDAKTATLVWQFRHSPDLFSPAMGSVQRMDDGSTLIGWGATNPSVTLVDPAGTTRLELSFPDGIFSYRAFGATAAGVTYAGTANDPQPTATALDPNYPNPFNPSTVITYRLSSDAEVRLAVYDLLGRELATLVAARQPAGTHRVTWDGRNAASGVYFCRLRAGGVARTVKMLLTR